MEMYILHKHTFDCPTTTETNSGSFFRYKLEPSCYEYTYLQERIEQDGGS